MPADILDCVTQLNLRREGLMRDADMGRAPPDWLRLQAKIFERCEWSRYSNDMD